MATKYTCYVSIFEQISTLLVELLTLMLDLELNKTHLSLYCMCACVQTLVNTHTDKNQQHEKKKNNNNKKELT